MKKGHPKPGEKEKVLARLKHLTTYDPDLSVKMLAERLSMSQVTVREYLRELGLYEERKGRRSP